MIELYLDTLKMNNLIKCQFLLVEQIFQISDNRLKSPIELLASNKKQNKQSVRVYVNRAGGKILG